VKKVGMGEKGEKREKERSREARRWGVPDFGHGERHGREIGCADKMQRSGAGRRSHYIENG